MCRNVRSEGVEVSYRCAIRNFVERLSYRRRDDSDNVKIGNGMRTRRE